MESLISTIAPEEIESSVAIKFAALDKQITTVMEPYLPKSIVNIECDLCLEKTGTHMDIVNERVIKLLKINCYLNGCVISSTQPISYKQNSVLTIKKLSKPTP